MPVDTKKTLSLEDFRAGQIMLIDKPLEWTSFQVVNKVRWLLCKQFKIKKLKVGHAGTLDPLASGLLILCIGRATKQIESFQNLPKEYTGTFHIGATTPSYDLETEIDDTFPIEHINEELLQETRHQFIGNIQQAPPIFSAIKQKGKRLFEYARKGQEVEIPTREIQIHEFDINRIELPEVDFRVKCGKGTYIRSLAHDYGKALDSGAHLTALRRTKIGGYDVENGYSIESVEEYILSL